MFFFCIYVAFLFNLKGLNVVLSEWKSSWTVGRTVVIFLNISSSFNKGRSRLRADGEFCQFLSKIKLFRASAFNALATLWRYVPCYLCFNAAIPTLHR